MNHLLIVLDEKYIMKYRALLKFNKALTLAVFVMINALLVGKVLSNELPILEFGGDFTLLNHHALETNLSDYKGKVVMMSFGFTSCPDICPVTLSKQKYLMKQLGEDASELQNILITIDPKRDTPDTLKNYLAYFDASFMGLTGTLDEIKSVARQYHSSFKRHEIQSSENYIFGHTVSVFLIDQQGRLRGHYKIEKEFDKLLADTRQLIESKPMHHPAAPQANDSAQPNITIEGAWVRALPSIAKNSVAYMTIKNNGESDDRLLSVHSPLATSVEVHDYFTENGMQVMRPVHEPVIPAQGSLLIKPSGLHIMLFDIADAPKVGSQVALTLKFENAGDVKVYADVKDAVAMTHNHH